jgi:hypothetical protein
MNLNVLMNPDVLWLARISHHPSAADADSLAVAVRTPSGRFDVVSATPAPSAGPCALPQWRLDALATKCGEKCGLATTTGKNFGNKVQTGFI